MLIERLKLNDFRNYESLLLRPDSGLNVIVGENAQGKTNAVEAIFLCAFGRSHRTSKDAELIKNGMSGGYVGLELKGLSGSRIIEIKLKFGERKQIFIDRLMAKRTGELMGALNAVMFSPEDLELVKGSPAERRRFMDMELSQLRPAYYYTLQRYNAALKQRNALLRPDIAKDAAELRKELYIWDEQLSRTGAEIMRMRAEFASRLSVIAGRLHKSISGERESLFVRYAPDVSVERLGGGDAQAALAEALYTGAMDDIRRGYTGSGPHRDELELSLNGANVRIYGSQGQQRTAALSLKLSELELIRAETDESPVLLLDDVLIALDEPRQRALPEAMSDCQTFLTCTTLEGLKRAGLRGINAWRCVDGTLERER